MTRRRHNWTTLDLELFHDEQLDADRVTELSDDLRQHAALRARLATVRRLDDAMTAALAQPRTASSWKINTRVLHYAAAACVQGRCAWYSRCHCLASQSQICNKPPPSVRRRKKNSFSRA
jgi:hypothetical protein